MVQPLQERAALREGFRSGSDFLTSIPVRSIVRSPGGSCAPTRIRRRCMMSRSSLPKANSSRDSKATKAFLRIGGTDPRAHLRDEDVNRAVSPVSIVPAVRECLTSHLRQLAELRDVVVVGRDIGSVVFPDTPFKFYIDASPHVRQQRRSAEGQDDEIATRDRIDSGRATAPLTIPRGALVIDTTHLSVDEVVDEMIHQLNARGLAIAQP